MRRPSDELITIFRLIYWIFICAFFFSHSRMRLLAAKWNRNHVFVSLQQMQARHSTNSRYKRTRALCIMATEDCELSNDYFCFAFALILLPLFWLEWRRNDQYSPITFYNKIVEKCIGMQSFCSDFTNPLTDTSACTRTRLHLRLVVPKG